MLDGLPEGLRDFEPFFERRRTTLRTRIGQLLSADLDQSAAPTQAPAA